MRKSVSAWLARARRAALEARVRDAWASTHDAPAARCLRPGSRQSRRPEERWPTRLPYSRTFPSPQRGSWALPRPPCGAHRPVPHVAPLVAAPAAAPACPQRRPPPRRPPLAASARTPSPTKGSPPLSPYPRPSTPLPAPSHLDELSPLPPAPPASAPPPQPRRRRDPAPRRRRLPQRARCVARKPPRVAYREKNKHARSRSP